MSEGPKSGSSAAGLTIASGIVDRDGDRGIAPEDVDHLHAGGVAAFFWVDVGLSRDRLEGAILPGKIVLPMMIEGPAVAIVEVHSPEIDEVEATLHCTLLERLEFLGGDFRQRGDEALELDV